MAETQSQPDSSSGGPESKVENSQTETAPAEPLVQIQPDSGSPSNAEDGLEINPDSKPQALVEWGLARFSNEPIVLTSSFGMEGCALMDMCSKAIAKKKLEPITVACIDTGFFFPETKKLREKLIQRYDNLNFVTWETPVSIQDQAKTYGENLWKNNPNMCCHIRKVLPMRENVINYRVWMTALRRSQTKQRADTPVIGWDWRFQLLKFCPLASWTRAQVWQYIQDNEVPFNQLHLQNYPSVSCFHCTKPVPGSSPDSDARGGRWEGKDKDECGLHFSI